MNWGATLGFALIGISVVFYVLGMTESKPVLWLRFAVLAGGIFMGTKAVREENNGFISYTKALGSGTAVAFFASIIIAFYTFIFFHFIDPAMAQQLLNRAEMKLVDKGMSDSEIEMYMKYLKNFMTPHMMAIILVPFYTFFGFIISLITSAILRKEDNSFESNFK